MAKGNHSFTEQDIHSRFGAIVGRTVADVDTAGVLAASKASRNKGRDGILFVRGTGTDASDKPVTVNGVRMYRQNVWIKGTELANILERLTYL